MLSRDEQARVANALDFWQHPATPGQVVQQFRRDPEMRQLVLDCYWDEDPVVALRRFQQSDEFAEILRIFRKRGIRAGARLLDLGAGNGIASHALHTSGYNVTALEPDDCPIVGHQALSRLNSSVEQIVPVVAGIGEGLPFRDHAFDAVYCRQVLHHIPDLLKAAREIHRVLRPGGVLLATREHVVSDSGQLRVFLAHHPVHQCVGGENAYLLTQYLDAVTGAGFTRLRTIGPFESVVNFFPMSVADWERWCSNGLSIRFGPTIARSLSRFDLVRCMFGRWASARDQTPGRLYSFVAIA